MKKTLKLIPLLFIPFLLGGCSVFDYGENPDEMGSSYVYPTSISISGDSSIFIGETKQLTYNIEPNTSNPRILWSSSNSNIVEAFAKGRIKGKGVGTATITATAEGSNGEAITGSFTVSCSAPAVSGISFAKDHKDIRYNTTYQLEPIVSPEFALDKSVSYVSSNPSIATVNSDGVVAAGSTTGSTVITATTNEGGYTADITINVKEYTGTTLMVYMCGSDLESGPEKYIDGSLTGNIQGLGSLDIQEMTMAEGQPEDVNIVIETGGANEWRNSLIRNDELGLWEIRNQQLVKRTSKPDASMGASDTLKEFITWGVSNYPADHYGLLMWNHGGAMSGICFDEIHGNDTLKADEINTALDDAKDELGMDPSYKFEFIAYDACLMAIQDVAEINARHFNYMLASQESESGTGYDYDAFLPDLYDDPGMRGDKLLEKIADTFLDEQKRFSKHNNQTQSIYKLSEMYEYRDAFEDLASELLSNVLTTLTARDNFVNLIDSAKQYGYVQGASHDGYAYYIYDIKSVFALMKADEAYSSVSNLITLAETALDEVVIYEKHGDGTSGCGMNLYCPFNGSYDSNQSNFENWMDLVSAL